VDSFLGSLQSAISWQYVGNMVLAPGNFASYESNPYKLNKLTFGICGILFSTATLELVMSG